MESLAFGRSPLRRAIRGRCCEEGGLKPQPRRPYPGHHPGPWRRCRPGTQGRAASERAAGRSRSASSQT